MRRQAAGRSVFAAASGFSAFPSFQRCKTDRREKRGKSCAENGKAQDFLAFYPLHNYQKMLSLLLCEVIRQLFIKRS